MSPTDQQWKKIREEKQQRIEKAISQRERSIAYFNSVNSAISLLGEKAKFGGNKEDKIVKEFLIKWRDWFYSQWRDWYMDTIPIPEPDIQAEKAEEFREEEKRKEDNIKYKQL